MGVLTKPSSNEMDVKVDANIRGVQYSGNIHGKIEPNKPTKVTVDIKKGAESVLQLVCEMKTTPTKTMVRGRYSVMGGKVAQGNLNGKYENGVLEIDVDNMCMCVFIHVYVYGNCMNIMSSVHCLTFILLIYSN